MVEPTRVKVGEFANSWLEDVAKQQVRITTLANYKRLVALHIAPHIGGVRLNKLSPVHLQAWQTTLERRSVSPMQRHAAHVLLKTILRSALRLGLIARNPLEAVDKPRIARRELQVLTPDQLRTLLASTAGHRLRPLLVLAVSTGARLGELFGLQWRDIDLDAGFLTIQRTLVEVSGHIEFGEPKTSRSRRRVDLPTSAVQALRDHRRQQPAIPHPNMLVFTDTVGKPLRRSNFTRRVWHHWLEKAELPRVKFHSLRHSHITSLLAAGGNLKAVSERVGHSRTSMTSDVYAHAVEGMQRDLASKLDQMFG
jgi:integrase